MELNEVFFSQRTRKNTRTLNLIDVAVATEILTILYVISWVAPFFGISVIPAFMSQISVSQIFFSFLLKTITHFILVCRPFLAVEQQDIERLKILDINDLKIFKSVDISMNLSLTNVTNSCIWQF